MQVLKLDQIDFNDLPDNQHLLCQTKYFNVKENNKHLIDFSVDDYTMKVRLDGSQKSIINLKSHLQKADEYYGSDIYKAKRVGTQIEGYEYLSMFDKQLDDQQVFTFTLHSLADTKSNSGLQLRKQLLDGIYENKKIKTIAELSEIICSAAKIKFIFCYAVDYRPNQNRVFKVIPKIIAIGYM